MDNFGKGIVILPTRVYPLVPKDSHSLKMQNTFINPKLLKFSTHNSINLKSKKSHYLKCSIKIIKVGMCEMLGTINPEAKFLSIGESVRLKN